MKKGQNLKLRAFIVLFAVLMLNLPALSVTNANMSCLNAANPIQLMTYASQYVRIEGVICETKLTDDSKVIFLNFGKNFNTSLSAVIYDIDIHSFAKAGIGEPQDFFKNKKVVMEGIIRMFNGKPEIVINNPEQIKIIEN